MTTPDAPRPMTKPQASAHLIILGAVFAALSTILVIVGSVRNADAYLDQPGNVWIGIGAMVGLAALWFWVLAAFRVASAVDELARQRYEESRFRV